MRRSTAIAIVFTVAITGVYGHAPTAHAACNALPSPGSLVGKQPAPETQVEDGRLPYRGALGSMDRGVFTPSPAYATPDTSETLVTLGPDGCGGGTLELVESKDDLIITFVFEEASDNNRPRVTQLAAPTQHAALSVLGKAEAKAGFVFNGVFPNTGVALIRATVAGNDERRLRFAMPTVAQIGTTGDPTAPHFQNTRVIVTRRDATPPLAQLVAKHCAGFVFASENKPLACIDTIYSSYPTLCAITDSARDPFSCHANTSFGPRIDFGKQCYPGPHSVDGPKDCDQQPGSLHYIVDGCGNLRLRFSWKSIIDDPSGRRFSRSLRGLSAISRTATGVDERIRVPGREFLASTHNTAGGGNPHKPKFTAHPNASFKNAMDLSGVADKDRSTLWILPRMPVTYVCEGTQPVEACMGIVNEQTGCVCPSRTMCTCGPPVPPTYFACSGDPDLLYQPCTNSSHCGTGKCNAPARCVPEMSAWSTTPPQGNLCNADGIAGGCATDQEQCGYSLFEQRDAPGEAILRDVDYLITDPIGTNRGVCLLDFSRTCGVAGSDGCTRDDGTDVGPCTAYYFESGDVVP